jgi:hypothetical protein
MWALFSPWLRRWLLIAVALPLARLLVHELTVIARRRNPHATITRVLATVDSAMSAASRLIGRR